MEEIKKENKIYHLCIISVRGIFRFKWLMCEIMDSNAALKQYDNTIINYKLNGLNVGGCSAICMKARVLLI